MDAVTPQAEAAAADAAVEPAGGTGIGARDERDGERRLPVGDFLVGALFVRGPQALPFTELARTATGSGLDISQVLAWLERAEASGLVERVTSGDSASGRHPAVRLTPAGIDVARHNRRGADGAEVAEPSLDARQSSRP